MQETVPLDEIDLQKWLSNYYSRCKKIKRTSINKRNLAISENDHERANYYNSHANSAHGRMIVIESIQSKTSKNITQKNLYD